MSATPKKGMTRSSPPRLHGGLHARRFFTLSAPVRSIAAQDVVTIKETDPLGLAVSRLREGYRKLPVLRRGRLVGMVTVRGVLDALGAGERHAEFSGWTTPVKQIAEPVHWTIPATATIEQALDTFRRHGRGSYPVLEKGKVVGMIADWDFVKRLHGTFGIPVHALMTHTPSQVREHYPIRDVAKIMVHGGFRRLPVTKRDVLTGMIVPHDILHHLHAQGLKVQEAHAPIHTIMKTNVHTIQPGQDIGEAIHLMKQQHVGGLPVCQGRELVGILTESDLVHGLV